MVCGVLAVLTLQQWETPRDISLLVNKLFRFFLFFEQFAFDDPSDLETPVVYKYGLCLFLCFLVLWALGHPLIDIPWVLNIQNKLGLSCAKLRSYLAS